MVVGISIIGISKYQLTGDQAEIAKSRDVVCVDQDVTWLDVPMNLSASMK